jgi:hypothetical protein
MRHASYLVLAIVMFCAACSIATVRLRDIDNGIVSGFGSRSQTLADVHDALIRAAGIRGWVIDDIEPGHAIGRIVVRGKHHVTIDITYSSETMSMTYVDSSNMDYEVRADGRYIHVHYNKWIYAGATRRPRLLSDQR